MKQSMEKLRRSSPTPASSRSARLLSAPSRRPHDIGKNLVGICSRALACEVIDLGTYVSPATFVGAVRERGVGADHLSALLTTTMPAMKETIAALQEAGYRDQVMTRAVPPTQAYADEIGADGYAPDAASAVDTAKALLDHCLRSVGLLPPPPGGGWQTTHGRLGNGGWESERKGDAPSSAFSSSPIRCVCGHCGQACLAKTCSVRLAAWRLAPEPPEAPPTTDGMGDRDANHRRADQQHPEEYRSGG